MQRCSFEAAMRAGLLESKVGLMSATSGPDGLSPEQLERRVKAFELSLEAYLDVRKEMRQAMAAGDLRLALDSAGALMIERSAASAESPGEP